jgi:hypothetical protein
MMRSRLNPANGFFFPGLLKPSLFEARSNRAFCRGGSIHKNSRSEHERKPFVQT